MGSAQCQDCVSSENCFTEWSYTGGESSNSSKHLTGSHRFFGGCEESKSDAVKSTEDHGIGIQKSGGTYTGEWEGQQRNGYGVMVWPDSSRYEGFTLTVVMKCVALLFLFWNR